MRWSDRHWLGLILALYLIIGSLYAITTPAWQAPDEPAHYNYVRYLAENGRLPVLRQGDYPHAYLEEIKSAHFPPGIAIDTIRYEFWQPPLYYILAVPIYHIGGGALLPLRLFSLLLGAGLVYTAYAIGLAVRPGDSWLALAVAAFVAFLPMHLSMMASVNNDSLAELLLALIVLRLMRHCRQPDPSPRSLALTGLLLGLALITKATVYYVAPPLVFVGLLLAAPRLRSALGQLVLVFGVALAVSLAWFVRNLIVYGWPDIIGKINHDQVVVGQLRTSDALALIGWFGHLSNFFTTTFHSFWGQFGWMAVPMDPRSYFLLTLLTVLGLVGFGLSAWHSLPRLWKGLKSSNRDSSGNPVRRDCLPALLAGLWLMLALLGYLYYNVTFVQFQARYLFPALIPIGLLMAEGWRTILSRRWAGLGAVVAALVTVVQGMGGIVNQALDKRCIAVGGAITIALIGRRWLRLPAGWNGWIAAVPLVLMAGLAVYSPFAFIRPFL